MLIKGSDGVTDPVFTPAGDELHQNDTGFGWLGISPCASAPTTGN